MIQFVKTVDIVLLLIFPSVQFDQRNSSMMKPRREQEDRIIKVD